ncbi:nucleotide disphospho-sugar-binding domain-containing protein [Nonomuraea sp. B5E05]|uniref:nucleotide disphospho-sugar-binding domain-containing protein n=1 Tax=Nonomuraea sp. B5E05 TaxID=3153569 RepID=UPI0032608E6D
MRVLFVTTNWGSHYYHLVPLVWAMRATGHEVYVSCEPSFAETIVRSGATAVPTSRDVDQDELMKRVLADPPDWPDIAPEGVSQEEWDGSWRAVSQRAFPMFAALAGELADDVLRQTRALRPDLIVYEPTSFVAPLVGAAMGIPAVRHVLGVDVIYMARNIVPPVLRPLADRLGVGDVDILGLATIDNCPPAMQLPSQVNRIRTRFVPYNGSGAMPDWLLEPSPRRRVGVSWGLCASDRGRGFLVPELVKALSEFDVEVVVTLSAADRKNLPEGELPGNARVVESLPLHLLMPSCDAMLHQSGISTMLTALSYGVPQLVLPQMPDELMESRPLIAAGAGIAVAPEAGLDTIAERAAELVTVPSYREAAGRLREEIRRQPSPTETVKELEAFVRD